VYIRLPAKYTSTTRLFHLASLRLSTASCLKLHTKASNPKHLLYETLNIKPSPKRLHSGKPLWCFVESSPRIYIPITSIASAFQSIIPAFGPQPLGWTPRRSSWVQLNLLLSGVAHFMILQLFNFSLNTDTEKFFNVNLSMLVVRFVVSRTTCL